MATEYSTLIINGITDDEQGGTTGPGSSAEIDEVNTGSTADLTNVANLTGDACSAFIHAEAHSANGGVLNVRNYKQSGSSVMDFSSFQGAVETQLGEKIGASWFWVSTSCAYQYNDETAIT